MRIRSSSATRRLLDWDLLGRDSKGGKSATAKGGPDVYGYHDAKGCFGGERATAVFQAHGAKMKKAVAKLTVEKMDQTDRDAWVDYFVSKYTIEPLELYPDSIEIGLDEKTVRVYNPMARMLPYQSEYVERPGIRATCRVAFTGDPDLFQLTPSTYSLSDTYEYDFIDNPDSEGIGYLHLSYELTQDRASAEAIRSHFESEVGAFKLASDRVNADAEGFNASLRSLVECAVDQRIGQLNKLATIKQGLNLPLNRVEGAPMALPIPLKKKRLIFSVPKPSTDGPARSIGDDDYAHVTEVIDGLCAIMEAAPGSYCAFDEEQLRCHLLGVLNTHYENATGETFRNHGKTDIYIPFEDHAAYIAECKCWHGRKKFLQAIEQLFSYTTWRDTKVSVIVFNKATANFEHVLDEIDGALFERAISVRRPKPSRWTCEIQNEQDERVMHVTVQVFNLYYSN